MTEDSEQSAKENKDNSKNNTASSRIKSVTSTRTNTSVSSQKRDKSRDTQQTRVVIRHLPPTMTSEEFLEAISPIPEYNDYYFCRTDMSLGAFGFCRAYINFLHMEDVFVFKDKFDGYVFVDTKGNEFVAIVEFAPFQRIPRRRFGTSGALISAKKRDNKCGTIKEDSDYIQFLEDLEKMKNETNMPSADIYLEEIEARDKQLRANHGVVKVSTPLIEFIKNRKLEKNRLREERREERKRQQMEQKRIREEEQQKKLKLLKSDDNKSSKDSDQRGRERTEKSSKSEEDRLKYKSKDLDKKNRSSRSSDSKRIDIKKPERIREKSNPHKSEKPKDSKDSQKESKDKESTFVVKVVPNTDDTHKSETISAEGSDPKKSDNNNKETSNEQNIKSKESKADKSESLSKNTNESSSKSEGKRIRNKDRPTREIYRPGATKRGSQSDSSQGQSNSQKTSANKSEQNTGYKQRVFTRSKH